MASIFYILNPDDEYEESESGGGWINWFCELEGHDFFTEVNKTKSLSLIKFRSTKII